MRRRRTATALSGKTSQGGRGAGLENLINYTNELYRKRNIAMVQKIPTPITPISMQGAVITKAFFSEKSTVDYIGVCRKQAICFDAKECHTMTFPLKNIHDHQIEFMKSFSANGGLSFLILYFSENDIFYYMPLDELLFYVRRMDEGGRKSIRFEELDKDHLFSSNGIVPVPYIEKLNLQEF